jgi:hypothetical protein
MEIQTWAELKKEFLKNKEIAKEYEKLGPKFELEKMAIQKRMEKKMAPDKQPAAINKIRNL